MNMHFNQDCTFDKKKEFHMAYGVKNSAWRKPQI